MIIKYSADAFVLGPLLVAASHRYSPTSIISQCSIVDEYGRRYYGLLLKLRDLGIVISWRI